MFKVNKERVITDLPVIKTGFTALLSEDGEAILFTGENNKKKRILGSLVYEQEEKKYFRYFKVLVSEKEYEDFIQQKVTYLEILKQSAIFIVDKDYKGKIKGIYCVLSSDIPKEFLPLKSSFCPEIFREPLSLIGM